MPKPNLTPFVSLRTCGERRLGPLHRRFSLLRPGESGSGEEIGCDLIAATNAGDPAGSWSKERKTKLFAYNV